MTAGRLRWRGESDGIGERDELFPELLPLRPAALGDLAGEHLRPPPVAAGSDDDGDAVLFAVGEDETAEDGDVEDISGQLGAAARAVVDHVAVGAAGGEQAHGGGRQGQADEGRLWDRRGRPG